MLDITHQLFDQNFFILAMLIGTIDFYHFIWAFTDLDFGWGSQGQCKAKPAGFIFSHIFRLIRMKFDVMKQLKPNILKLLLSEISWNKENNCCLANCIKNVNIGMHLDVLWINLIQTWYDDRFYCTLHLDTSLTDLDLLNQFSHKVFSWFEWNFAHFRDLLVWITSYCFCLGHSTFKGENSTDMIFVQKTLALACIQTFTDQFLSNLVYW